MNLNKDVILGASSKAFLLIFGYLVAYLNGPFSLILVTLLTLVWLQFKTESPSKNIKAKTRASKLTKSELQLLLNNELPSWVTFPDRERAEWLNRTLGILWPNISNWVIKKLRTNIQTKIRKKLDSFRFEEIDFGEIAPRIDGVKIYPKTKDCIIIDFDVYYDGNCDINFSISGTQIGRLKDFQLGVEVRVILKPLLTKLPLIGGIQVFFLNTPEIHFEIDGISKLPGLNYLLRQKIEQKINKIIVFPNCFSKRFTKTIQAAELKSLEPEGILRVHVFEAKDLEKKDVTGKSDPYVILSVGAQQFVSRVIKKSLDPKWDQWYEFIVLDPLAQQLFYRVYDQDDFNEDDFLGSGAAEIHEVIRQGKTDQWFKLEKTKHGEIHLRFTWLSLSPDVQDLQVAINETGLLHVATLSQALLTIYVDSARNLPKTKSFRKPDCYFKILLNDKMEFKSKTKKYTVEPSWEQGTSILVPKPEQDLLKILIFDKSSETLVAQFHYPVVNLLSLTSLQISKEVFCLNVEDSESLSCQLVLSLQLRILRNALFEEYEDSTDSEDNFEMCTSKPETPQDELDAVISRTISSLSDSPSKKPQQDLPCVFGKVDMTVAYNEMRQRLIVTIHQIKDLPVKDADDLPDAYVKLKFVSPRTSPKKQKTKVVTSKCSPTYEEMFEFLVPQGEFRNSRLLLTVKFKKFFSNEVVGQIVLDFSTLELAPNGSRFWKEIETGEESD